MSFPDYTQMRPKNRLLSLYMAISIAGLSACGSSEDSAAESTGDDQYALAAFVGKMVRDQLIDPESARFLAVHAYRTGEKLSFCGQVNSKNQLGGYTGLQPFILSDSGLAIGGAVTDERKAADCQGVTTIPLTL